jgi:hypothetical protein
MAVISGYDSSSILAVLTSLRIRDIGRESRAVPVLIVPLVLSTLYRVTTAGAAMMRSRIFKIGVF